MVWYCKCKAHMSQKFTFGLAQDKLWGMAMDWDVQVHLLQYMGKTNKGLPGLGVDGGWYMRWCKWCIIQQMLAKSSIHSLVTVWCTLAKVKVTQFYYYLIFPVVLSTASIFFRSHLWCSQSFVLWVFSRVRCVLVCPEMPLSWTCSLELTIMLPSVSALFAQAHSASTPSNDFSSILHCHCTTSPYSRSSCAQLITVCPHHFNVPSSGGVPCILQVL